MPMTDAELKDFLNHHVTYELVQLEDAFMLARTEPVSGGRMNAYIKIMGSPRTRFALFFQCRSEQSKIRNRYFRAPLYD